MLTPKRSDDIQDLIAYLRQVSGLDHIERKGAKKNQIDKYLQLVREYAPSAGPVPSLLLQYFQEFGRSDPVLEMGNDGVTKISVLIEIYENARTAEYKDIPPGAILISSTGLTGGRALVYSNEGPHDEEPLVVECWGMDLAAPMAKNFRNHLYQQAFGRGRLPSSCDYRVLITKQTGQFDPLREFAEQQGFVPHWFGDQFCQCMERDDSVWLAMCRKSRDRTFVWLAGPNPDGMNAVRTAFLKHFELHDSSPK